MPHASRMRTEVIQPKIKGEFHTRHCDRSSRSWNPKSEHQAPARRDGAGLDTGARCNVHIVVGRPGVYSSSQTLKKWYSQLPCIVRVSCIRKGLTADRTSRQSCSLKSLTGRLHLHVADRWPSRTSPGYNCEVANPACRKSRLVGTHQW